MYVFYSPGPIVLVEECLEVLDDCRVVFCAGARSYQSLFLTSPVSCEDRPLWVGIGFLEDPHRLHHHYGPGPIVGCPGRGVPGVEVRGEDDVFVWFLGPSELADDIEHRYLAEPFGLGIDPDSSLTIGGQAVE